METIFVQIPAYKDEEIIPIVKNLYAKAKHPDHINVGICWQNRLDGDSGELNIEGPGENVRILNMRASAGVGWAKRHAQSLYQNEDYVLAVDSHSRFAEDWDTTLIESPGQCPSSKAILSSSPHPYRLHGQTLVEETATFRYPSHYAANGFLKLVALRFNTVPQRPLQASFLSPRFMFSKAQLIQDVPADPFIYFSEEEITLSMRA
ncbi:MAG: UDP-N-acetylglucosamine-transferase [Pseudomonadales bacterium]|nr:UDP-N-acetylglucosamine-transferase [Pseudomonadales bacterium]